ncbi:FAD-dependent oxidoreductase [Mycobacterium sp. Y57]|uniref:FAD-dependent oxidoreductase n=1 Tax=Mycolicibacterium xanthum TaxID=2796469 RepID=UPI001C8466D9|nr:FAD-dependent oxidoreductase [Mycolicibacterium xanthum]MBX7432676.1 FAD-dependent oxidoreductase [Mycolicibacterium xanthum]
MTDDQIVIVGGGSTGCTLALHLARRGISSIVLERREEPLVHPAAHVINARSLEIWHQASPALTEELLALATPTEKLGSIRWCCGLAHEPLGEIDVAADPQLQERLRTYSPFLISHIGQHLLMPVFWAALEREPLVNFRRGTSVERVCERAGRMVVDIRPRSRPAERLSARYVVAADGANSTVRERAGIAMQGRVLTHIGSVFFHAPRLFAADTPRPLLAWIYQPRFCGALVSHAADHYVLMTPYLHRDQAVARDSDAYWNRVLPEVLGMGQGFTVRSTGTWTMTSQIASRFRRGQLLLAGDAAHRFPPAGGFGLNSGVQDAQNLAWKIAAIIDAQADDALLDTYDPERRPVVERFARQSVKNFFRLDEVTAPLGITNRAICKATEAVGQPPLSWVPGRLLGSACDRATRLQTRRTKVLLAGGARGRRLRAQISATIPGQLEHFVFQGLEFGYMYRGPLIAPGPDDNPLEQSDIVTYRPTTRPGARLPHAYVLHEGRRVPVHDILCPAGLTLLTSSAVQWRAALRTQRHSAALPVLITCLTAADPHDQGELLALFEVGHRGAVLVRPDGHVAWRTTKPAPEGSSDLNRFLEERWLPYWQRTQQRHV